MGELQRSWGLTLKQNKGNRVIGHGDNAALCFAKSCRLSPTALIAVKTTKTPREKVGLGGDDLNSSDGSNDNTEFFIHFFWFIFILVGYNEAQSFRLLFFCVFYCCHICVSQSLFLRLHHCPSSGSLAHLYLCVFCFGRLFYQRVQDFFNEYC